jgi:hypothetical protein
VTSASVGTEAQLRQARKCDFGFGGHGGAASPSVSMEAGVGGRPGCTTMVCGASVAGSDLGLAGSYLRSGFFFNKNIFGAGEPKRPPPRITIFGVGPKAGDSKARDFFVA